MIINPRVGTVFPDVMCVLAERGLPPGGTDEKSGELEEQF